MTESNVLIVGAGPVGLTLAIDLAWRGIDVTVVETPGAGRASRARNATTSPPAPWKFSGGSASPKKSAMQGCPRISARYSYRTSLPGPELTRIHIPCRRERFTVADGPDCNWPTPEPPHRINQIFLEPILFEARRRATRIPHCQPDLGRRRRGRDTGGAREFARPR